MEEGEIVYRKVEDLSPSELYEILVSFSEMPGRPLVETGRLYSLTPVGIIRIAVEWILRERLHMIPIVQGEGEPND